MRAALYARFSTDKQREASIEDQFRECERVALREGMKVVARFSDEGVSGGTTNRKGYQKLLAAARQREFDVLITEDIDRLWRNRAEFGPRSAELEDLGVHWLSCVGDDTRREGWGLTIQIKAAMAEGERRKGSYRTRRGQEGVARAGKCAGGRSYGYIPAALSGTGQIEVDQAQAAVVRRIFEMFSDGHSPRAIADMLNRDGVLSPGVSWKREHRRKRGWVGSAIHGNPARGLGILNNDAYRGLVIWNRSRWIRSAADSSKRRCVQNPRKEWITRHDERLRVVSDGLWQRVKERQADQARRVGDRIKQGMSKADAIRTGAGPKYLLSSLLRCGHCGSSYAIAGRDVYACSGHTNSGASLCQNDARLQRKVAEQEVMAGIKRAMLAPESIEEICRRVRTALRKPKPKVPDISARIGELVAQVDNLADAIATGALRFSPALAARLAAAEAELEELKGRDSLPVTSVREPTPLLADLPARAIRAVERLEETLAGGDVARARQEIRAHVGTVKIEADEREIRLYSEKGAVETALLRAVGSNASLYGSGGRI